MRDASTIRTVVPRPTGGALMWRSMMMLMMVRQMMIMVPTDGRKHETGQQVVKNTMAAPSYPVYSCTLLFSSLALSLPGFLSPPASNIPMERVQRKRSPHDRDDGSEQKVHSCVLNRASFFPHPWYGRI